ncbi:response regulator [Pelagibacterium xiamenense]|uniref:response regulator n=1 Tax=Pelagibacterium xiamenense TaxID=2901140 RepID=UPI001E2B7671|nr:response regulator [Pelagibacterium xiamenense]MCD7060128.1 response regulator [Pelagibacterium xiamenense]
MAKTRVLMVSANPISTQRIMLDEEVRSIESRILLSEHRDSIELIPKFAARPQDLLEHLNRFRPHVLHFSGHGSETEEIVLTNEVGDTQPVSKAALIGLFKALKDDIRVVVLNACFSQRQAEAITEHIDCAIGMSQAIGDRAAITFAAAFYSALGFGRSIGQAFEQGALALMLEGIAEENTPCLVTRPGIDASKLHLFSIPPITPPHVNVRAETGQPMTALIVEDDGSIQALLGSLLRREGFAVLRAGTTEEAARLLTSSSVDLVLLDMELPDGNGLDFAREIRKDRKPGIIFLTRRSGPADKIAGLEGGGDDYITKPFDPEELLARIGSVMRRTAGHRATN